MKHILCLVLCFILCTVSLLASAATIGETSALGSAITYLSTMPFSYDGLIRQLEYSGFSSSESKYAADNCGADWYDQAARSATQYMSIMPLSKTMLIQQLTYSGFTNEEAQYGAAVAYKENPRKPGISKADQSTAEEIIPATATPTDTLSEEAISLEKTGGLFDLADLNNEELILLREQVNKELMNRGEVKSADVPAGEYIIGADIPEGTYSITTKKTLVSVRVNGHQSNYTVSPGDDIGKISLKNGDTFKVSGTVTLTQYTGISFK